MSRQKPGILPSAGTQDRGRMGVNTMGKNKRHHQNTEPEQPAQDENPCCA